MATAQSTAGMYLCGVCKAEYARSDHLIRHVRGHIKQRPFVCSRCGKGFGRQDLLKRHAATHSVNVGADAGRAGEKSAQNTHHSHRVHQACRSCAARKLKCTDQKPCKLCKEKNIPCDYSQASSWTRLQKPTEEVPEKETFEESSFMEIDGPDLDSAFDTNTIAHTQADDHDGGFDGPVLPTPQPTGHLPCADGAMQDMLGSTLDMPNFGDYIQFDADPNLDDIDFSFLDNFTTPASPRIPPMPLTPISNPTPQSSTMGIGTEAYQNSNSCVSNNWEPGNEKNDDSEHQNLVLPSDIGRPSDTGREDQPPLPAVRAVGKQDFSLAMRDRVIAMVLQTTPRATSERIIGTFPSPEVLGNLLNQALTHLEDKQVIAFIHLPTLSISQQRPELLGALIAYGSISSPSAAVRRFGYALQELVRLAISQKVEEEHAAVRELGIIQAFYIQLYLGYYSAINRKIEIAESNSMLGATALRRAKMLQFRTYQAPEAILAIPGKTLQQKWSVWGEQESMKRLVYFAATMDAHVSISRKINPLLPYAEIGTPVPSSRKLWISDSVDEWHKLLMRDIELRGQQPPPLCKVLRQPDLVRANQSIMDGDSAAMILFAGFWAMVHEYRQMEALVSDLEYWNDFVLNSRYSELVTLLEQLKSEVADFGNPCAKILIMQELVSLHLNASYYEITNYSGRGTIEDAQLAMPYVQRWHQRPISRLAVWHCGQIFRAAKMLDPRSLTDISAIAIYHAAETMCTWGFMRKAQAATSDMTATPVKLDGDETPEVSKFLKAARGRPGLTDDRGGFVPLDAPALMFDLANKIIINNWGCEQLPLTTEEVSRLMQSFASVCRRHLMKSSDTSITPAS